MSYYRALSACGVQVPTTRSPEPTEAASFVIHMRKVLPLQVAPKYFCDVGLGNLKRIAEINYSSNVRDVKRLVSHGN